MKRASALISKNRQIFQVVKNSYSKYLWYACLEERLEIVDYNGSLGYEKREFGRLIFELGICGQHQRCDSPAVICPYCGNSETVTNAHNEGSKFDNLYFFAHRYSDDDQKRLFNEIWESAGNRLYKYENCGCVSDDYSEALHWERCKWQNYSTPMMPFLECSEYILKLRSQHLTNFLKTKRIKAVKKSEIQFFQTINTARQLAKL